MPSLSAIMSRLKPIRAKLQINNAIFTDVLQTLYSGSCWNLYQSYSQNGNFRSIADAIPYSAGYSFISDGLDNNNGITNTLISLMSDFDRTDIGVQPYALVQTDNSPISPTFYDANETCKNLAGYLTFETVSEFLTRKKYKTATKIYGGSLETQAANISYRDKFVETDSNRNMIDSSLIYGNYIIPYIQWFADTNSGRDEIDTENHKIAVNNVIAYTAVNVGQQTSLGGSGFFYANIIKRLSKQGALFVSIPYLYRYEYDNTSDYPSYLHRNGIFSGSVVTRYIGGFDMYRREIVTSHAPYVSLAVQPDNPMSALELYQTYDGRYVCGGHTNFNCIVAYKSPDDVIKLFDDAGIFVSTDLADVYQHQEIVPTVNPEPTDSLDSYPDNTTDITPINSGYITPSSFGGQLIYNPLTAKSFFKWVGDSGVNISNWGRLFANPIDVVLGAKLYNLDLVQHDSAHVHANAKTDVLGVVNPDLPNYSIDIGYNNIVDGGTLNLIAYYGNYADFTSMTYQCYIPYVGFITLRAGDVVNTVLHLQYAVDFSTGSAVALLTSNQKLIFSAACNVAGNIPIAVSDRFSQELNNSITALRGVGNVILGAAQKNPFAVAGALKDTVSGLQLQTHYSQRGNLNSINAFELIPPFIERTRFDLFYPNNDADNYKKYVGTPSTQFDILAHCADSNGYVTANYVYLSDCPATAAEQAEIKRIISGGVYL